MALEGSVIDEELFGFVSRDQDLLDRADGEPEVAEEEVPPSPPPDVQQSEGVTAEEGGTSSSVASPPDLRKRGSMASVGSSRASVGSEDQTTIVKNKGAATEVTLPQAFQVKHLGRRDARGLWGIKHTRRPVDAMVAAAKNAAASSTGVVLPVVRLAVTREGVTISETARGKAAGNTTVAFHPIDSISYGVQDLVYTRVFSMIVVREAAELRGQHPFECHAFVCDSRAHARKLTYALAAAFHEYSRAVRAASGGGLEGAGKRSKKFAIDLRTPEQIEKDLQTPQEADSEA